MTEHLPESQQNSDSEQELAVQSNHELEFNPECLDELDDKLVAALSDAGIQTPTPIQQAAIPAILTGTDVMAGSKTGSGKTAAFALPLLSLLLNSEKPRDAGARALILAPTRELAKQLSYHFKALGKHTEITTATVIGGVSYDIQDEQLDNSPDIIVSTPGRLLELIRTKQIDLFDIAHIVLDEADRMLDMGFAGDVLTILEQCPEQVQILLFSATLEGPQIERLANQILHEPTIIEIDGSRNKHSNINQYAHLADSLEHKQSLLTHILSQDEMNRAVVFVNSREKAQILGSYLHSKGIHHAVIYGDLKQKTRNAMVAKLRKGDINVLVSTDLSARGLDISDISHVINYDMPRKADVYVHRIGRTGRAAQQGTAISLVEAHDYGLLERAERYIKSKIPLRKIKGLEPQHKKPKINKSKKKKKKSAKGKKK